MNVEWKLDKIHKTNNLLFKAPIKKQLANNDGHIFISWIFGCSYVFLGLYKNITATYSTS